VKFGNLLRHEAGLPFEVYTRDGERWKRVVAAGEASLACECAKMSEALNSHLAARREYQLADFDDHLDDIRRDWRNVGLVA